MIQLSEYLVLLKDALSRDEMITFACSCTVSYNGRAESFLDLGDRVVIIKKDKTVLVHQPEGNTPVNYMKPGTGISVHLADGLLQLSAKNSGEYMDIIIHVIYYFNSYALTDGRDLMLNGTERDMADMLFKNPDLIEKGFKPFSMEEHTKYGFIDLFGNDKKGNLLVVECKRYNGDLKAVSQLRRYVEKIGKTKGVTNVRGILACPSISGNALAMLKDFGYKYAEVKPPKFLERDDKQQKKLFMFSE